ncbi:MAG: Demethylmenaquinone methyltransferase, partial [uncultured Actinomycetospora sp.]
ERHPRAARPRPRRRRPDVRRGRRALRPHQHRAVLRPGRALAPRHARGPRGRAGRHGARRRRRHRRLHRRARPHRRPLPGHRLLAGHAAHGTLAARVPARREPGPVRRRRRAAPAVARRERRRGGHLLRAAQHRRRRRGARGVRPRHPSRRHARGLRVLAAHLGAVPPRLHRLPHARAAPRGPCGELEPRRVRLPRRVDPRLARPGRARRADRGRRLALGGLARPLGRHRRPAHGHASGL